MRISRLPIGISNGQSSQKKAGKAAKEASKPAPKAAAEEANDEAGDVSMGAADASKTSISTDGLSKNQAKKLKKKLAKEAKEDTKEALAAAEEPKKTVPAAKKAAEPAEDSLSKKASKRQSLPSGLSFTDAKVGDGPVAKKGQKVSMRYIGKLDSGKVFDSNTKGKAFTASCFYGIEAYLISWAVHAWSWRGHQRLGSRYCWNGSGRRAKVSIAGRPCSATNSCV